jgi:hypothetical protein
MSSPMSGHVLTRTSRAEWARLWTVRSTWWFAGSAALLMVGLGVALGFESAADPVELQGEPAWVTARYLVMPGQFAFLALVLTAVTSDYATGGIVPTLQWTPRRTVLFVARAAVTVVTALVVGLLLVVLAAVAAYTTAGGALTLETGDAVDVIGAVAFVLVAETILAVGLGFLLRSTAGALVTAFLLMLVLPLLLPGLGDWMSEVAERLPGSGAILLLVGEGPEMSTTSAVLVLSAWAVGVLALGWLRLVRDDANP